MAKKITVYTTTQCAFCLMVKKYLDSKNQTYETVNLDEHPEQREKVQEISGGMSVPVTVIEQDHQEPVVTVGWNPAKLSAALGL